jgi:hypothetical protein
MQDSPSDHFPVTAVLLRKPSQHRWQKASWRLLGFLPGLEEAELNQAAEQGELIYLTELQFQLHKPHCDAYYHNLMAEQPKGYLICSEDGDTLAPMLATVDFDEAASFMETDEMVLDAPLADALCVWLEHYVVAHYKPVAPKKRRRHRWFEADKGDVR